MANKNNKSINITHLQIQDKDGKPVYTLSDLYTAESKCGIGFDACNNYIVIKDIATTGATAGALSVIYVYQGAVVTKTLEDFKANGPAPAELP